MKNKRVKKILASGVTAATSLSTIAPIVSCSTSNNEETVNPFNSSFEDSDIKPLFNTTYDNTINLSNLQTSLCNGGPAISNGYNIKNNVGFTGFNTFKYQATITNDSVVPKFTNYIYKNLNVIAGTNTELSYKVFPSFGANTWTYASGEFVDGPDLQRPSSYISLDILYKEDGVEKSLAKTHPEVTDQNGYKIGGKEQGNSFSIYSNQWNSKKFDLSCIAGKQITAILLNFEFDATKETTDTPFAGESILGYIDDVSISDKTIIDGSSLTNYIDTRRGSNSSGNYSRGNNIPATCVPNGFNFYMPMTNANESTGNNENWEYVYAANNSDKNNLPVLQGLGISHETSPWMGERNQLSLMPQLADYVDFIADSDPKYRGYEFSHDDEIAQPDYYSVKFKNNLKAEIAPSSHSAVFRFTYPDSSNYGALIFDSAVMRSTEPTNQRDKWTFDQSTGEIKGWVLNIGWTAGTVGVTRMYVYGKVSNKNFTIQTTGWPEVKGVDKRQNLTFTLGNNKVVEVRLATSFISLDQAKSNLAQEIGDSTFEQVKQNATNLWNTRLSAIDLSKSNATQEERITLYSNLYRLNMYPNEQFENVTDISVNPQITKTGYWHASPVLPTNGDADDNYTNATLVEGKMYVNTGFWDTYRTVWPAYQLLYPEFTNELIAGFLMQYDEGGYTSRWSSPGYGNCMTGTSSDCAFADAYTSGVVTDINLAIKIYKSALANALQYSNDSGSGDNTKGRKYINTATYHGYTTADNGESVSWSLEGYINDWAISQMGKKMLSDSNFTESSCETNFNQTKQQFSDTNDYLAQRAKNYNKLFDPDTKFFRGKDVDETTWHDQNNPLSGDNSNFDPLVWGNEFTETNGWNFAFTAQFDIPGLISLYESQNDFKNKLDQFFSIPETAKHWNNYGNGMHEMIEAKDVRLGQLTMNNQPSHHIPYMYAAAGVDCYKTQALTREILQRMYVGTDIGHGYLGDEDNGEMSGWYILSSLGLYNVGMGNGEYTITSPLFNNVTINRDNETNINIIANNNSIDNVYIDSLSFDSQSILNTANISQSQLFDGNNHTLTFNMTNQPTTWGNHTITGVSPVGTNHIKLKEDTDTYANLFNYDLKTGCSIDTNTTLTATVDSGLNDLPIPTMFTIASGGANIDKGEITKIEIYGSNDGSDWGNAILKIQDNTLSFLPYEIKQFKLSSTSDYQYYKFVFYTTSTIEIGELELLY